MMNEQPVVYLDVGVCQFCNEPELEILLLPMEGRKVCPRCLKELLKHQLQRVKIEAQKIQDNLFPEPPTFEPLKKRTWLEKIKDFFKKR